MTFKSFFILFAIGIVLLCGLIFFIRQQNIGKTSLSTDETLPPLTPRTAEIPDEIRQKFAKIPVKPILITEFKHSKYIDSVEFSPLDSSLLVSAAHGKNYNRSVKLWDINDTSEPIATLPGDSVSFSPDGKFLAISGLRDSVGLWDIGKGKFIHSFRSYGRNAVFSPDGRWLASGVTDVQLWDIRTPTAVKKGPEFPTEGLTKGLAFSQDGEFLAIADTINKEVNIWDVVSLKHIKTLNFDTRWIEALTFSPESDNPLLAISDDDNKIRLYSSQEWNEHAAISVKYINDLTFTPDGETIVSGGTHDVEFWSLENGERIASIEEHSSWVDCVDISDDGQFVACGYGDGFIRVWNIAEYLPIHQNAPSDVVMPIYFLPSNRAPQPDALEKVDKLLKDVQKFFADEMERHGLERKTFTFQKNEDGSAKIYLFEGRTTDDYYLKNTARKVRKEIYNRFDRSKNVYLILVDISYEKSDKAKGTISARPELIMFNYKKKTWVKRGGAVIMPADTDGYPPALVSNMLGYTMGLDRNFRDASHLMSEGRKQKQLSKSSAEWLNKSRFFNPHQTSYDEPSKIEKLSPLEGNARFNVQDTDGIYQVRFLVKPTDENPPPGYQKKKDPEQNKIDWETTHKGKNFVLYDYLTMNAEKAATVEFDFPKFAKNLIRVKIIDGHGNMLYREMNLVDKKENITGSLIRRIFKRH